jgi:hypothetical protein
MSTKPEIKVYFKAADGGGFADLCAFWRSDNGMLSGRLDKKIVAIKVLLSDGSERVLRPDDKGRVDGWYLDCRIEGEARGAPPARAAAPTRRAAPPTDDFPDDDEIPF